MKLFLLLFTIMALIMMSNALAIGKRGEDENEAEEDEPDENEDGPSEFSNLTPASTSANEPAPPKVKTIIKYLPAPTPEPSPPPRPPPPAPKKEPEHKDTPPAPKKQPKQEPAPPKKPAPPPEEPKKEEKEPEAPPRKPAPVSHAKEDALPKSNNDDKKKDPPHQEKKVEPKASPLTSLASFYTATPTSSTLPSSTSVPSTTAPEPTDLPPIGIASSMDSSFYASSATSLATSYSLSIIACFSLFFSLNSL